MFHTTPANPMRAVIAGNRVNCTGNFGCITIEINSYASGASTSKVQQVIIESNICNQASTGGFSTCIYVADDGGSPVADATKTQGFVIRGNYCSGPCGQSVITYYGGRALITQNIILQTGAGRGIFINQTPTSITSSNLVISDNIVLATGVCTASLMDLNYCTHTKIKGNLIQGSSTATAGHGILVNTGCSFLDIEHNRIEAACQAGIDFVTLSDINCHGNVIYNPNEVDATSGVTNSGIVLPAAPAGTRNVIENNKIYDDRGTHQMRYAVVIPSAPTGTLPYLLNNIMSGANQAICNNLTSAYWIHVRGNETDVPSSFPAAPSTPAVPASGSAYTNAGGYDIELHVYGGSGSGLTFTRSGGSGPWTIWAGTAAAFAATVLLHPGDAVTATYTSAPTYEIVPQP
jgi:hypothetical protein